jgi:hypothetical protein
MIELPPKPIRATVHRSVMPNWTGVRIVLSGPAELLDQIMIETREGFRLAYALPGEENRQPSRRSG